MSNTADAQTEARQAVWTTPKTTDVFHNASSSASPQPAKRLAWGTSSGGGSNVRQASGFTEINSPRSAEPSRPKPFPVIQSDAERQRMMLENARKVALMRSAADSARRIRTVAAEAEILREERVAERIPMNPNPYGDSFNGPSTIPGAAGNPHLDPFGDAQPMPTVTLTPAPAEVPKPAALYPEPVTPLPEFTSTLEPGPSAPLTLKAAPEPLPDFEPKQLEPIAVEPEPPVVETPVLDTPVVEAPIVETPPVIDLPPAFEAPPVEPRPAASSPVATKVTPFPTPTPAPAAIPPVPAPLAAPAIENKIQQPLNGIQRTLTSSDGIFDSDLEVSQALPDVLAPDGPPESPDLTDPFRTDPGKAVPEFPEYKEPADLPAPVEESEGLPEIKEPARPGDEDRLDPLEIPQEPGDESEEEEESDEEESDEEESEDDEDDEDEEDEDEDEDGEASKKREVICDRSYNDRNCCGQDQLCARTTAKLLETRIQDLSVSITPPLVPLAEDDTEVEEQRERLAKSPVNEWTNRQGTLIATGQLVDFRDESVIVETIEGGRMAIPYFNLSHDDLCFLTAWWRLPGECVLAGDDRFSRSFQPMTFTWKAAATCHKPLYFEEVQLERYGHSAGPVLQPLLSTAHFISNIQLFPYYMGVYPPNECRYTLGHYRPGSCAPWLMPAFPLSHRGVAWEMGAAFGLWGLF